MKPSEIGEEQFNSQKEKSKMIALKNEMKKYAKDKGKALTTCSISTEDIKTGEVVFFRAVLIRGNKLDGNEDN